MPVADDRHRRLGSPPEVLAILLIPVAIPEEIEAGAAADLTEPQRQTRARSNAEEPAEERSAAAHLVRLHLGAEAPADFLEIGFERLAEGVPDHRRLRRPAHRREEARQLCGAAVEHDAMRGS